MTDGRSVQERYAPTNHCFGCGVANPDGLRIRSFPDPEDPAVLVCRFQPAPHHEAFDGVLNGGIIGTLLDCHSNWTATWTLLREDGLDTAPCTVTADFHVTMRRPTPSREPVDLRAEAVERDGSKVIVDATLSSGGVVTATCRGTFVAVRPGHPAYHRW